MSLDATTLHALHARAAHCAALAQALGVPTPVVEFLDGLMQDYPAPSHPRIARLGDAASLKAFTRIARQAGGAEYLERFWWDGQEYLLGFTYGH
jgi:hypothetical protein